MATPDTPEIPPPPEPEPVEEDDLTAEQLAKQRRDVRQRRRGRASLRIDLPDTRLGTPSQPQSNRGRSTGLSIPTN